MSHGNPAKCTGKTARVRTPTRASASVTSMLSVPAETSQNTGTAPASRMA